MRPNARSTKGDTCYFTEVMSKPLDGISLFHGAHRTLHSQIHYEAIADICWNKTLQYNPHKCSCSIIVTLVIHARYCRLGYIAKPISWSMMSGLRLNP